MVRLNFIWLLMGLLPVIFGSACEINFNLAGFDMADFDINNYWGGDDSGSPAEDPDTASETDGNLSPPEAQDFIASPMSGAIGLYWTNPADPGFAAVLILRRTDRFPLTIDDGEAVYDGPDQSCIDWNVRNDEEYHYTLFVYNTKGQYSGGVQAYASPSSQYVPNVYYLSATPGDQLITLSWTNPADSNFAGVRVLRRQDRYPNGPNDGTLVCYGDSPACSDIGLCSEAVYYYKVFSYSANNVYSRGVAIAAQPDDSLPPANISNFLATTNGEEINLSWNRPGDVDFLGVKILRKNGSSNSITPPGLEIYNGSGLNFKDINLLPGTYFYQAQSYDEVPNYSMGTEVWATIWAKSYIDLPKSFSDFYCRALALDTAGRPHIVFGGDHLYLASFNGEAWTAQLIDNASSVGTYASIAIDQTNKKHISYYDSARARLKYATDVSGEWVIQTPDPQTYGGYYTGLALDSENNPHICYLGNSTLKYTTNRTGQWVSATVDSTNYAGYYSSMALDSDNIAHISYYSNGSLHYATNPAGFWNIVRLPNGSAGQYTSIAIDSQDKVHISFYDGVNYDLKYATNQTEAWEVSPVHTAGSAGTFTSIAVDTHNNDAVYISYIAGGYVYLASKATGQWVMQPVDSSSYGGQYTSIAIDSSGARHISYMMNSTLKYATDQSAAWVVTPVDYNVWLGERNSLGIDKNQNLHVSFTSGNNLIYAFLNGGEWHKTQVDTGVYHYLALATDSNNKAHISYLGNYYLRYATNVTGEWLTEPVDSATFYVGMQNALAVDKNNKIHISYADNTNKDLKYATNQSGNWVVTPVDISGGGCTSIALDTNNQVHISYFDYINGNVKYATNVSGSWAKRTIDINLGQYGGYNSIAVDKNNKVHISYHDYNLGHLRYATNQTGNWELASIDAANWAYYNNIQIDSQNHVHIAYKGSSVLRYMTNASGNWIKSALDTAVSTGWPSIVIDAKDQVYISYLDETNKDLKLTTNKD